MKRINFLDFWIFGRILGTKRVTGDPLVSKQPDFGSHGLSTRGARRSKSRIPKGPPSRSWGPESPLEFYCCYSLAYVPGANLGRGCDVRESCLGSFEQKASLGLKLGGTGCVRVACKDKIG